jgi:argininosuccinate lyase
MGRGAHVTLQVPGAAGMSVELVDMSRATAALACELVLQAGAEVTVRLPGTTRALQAQVVRVAGGIMAITFGQDPKDTRELDNCIAAIQALGNQMAA